MYTSISREILVSFLPPTLTPKKVSKWRNWVQHYNSVLSDSIYSLTTFLQNRFKALVVTYRKIYCVDCKTVWFSIAWKIRIEEKIILVNASEFSAKLDFMSWYRNGGCKKLNFFSMSTVPWILIPINKKKISLSCSQIK